MITCEICQDLLPLVEDAVASEDSTKAVEYHLKTCTNCEGEIVQKEQIALDEAYIMEEILRQLCIIPLFTLVFCAIFPLGLWKEVLMVENAVLGLLVGLTLGVFLKKGDYYLLVIFPALFALTWLHSQSLLEISDVVGRMTLEWGKTIFFYLVLGWGIGKLSGFIFGNRRKRPGRKVRKNISPRK